MSPADIEIFTAKIKKDHPEASILGSVLKHYWPHAISGEIRFLNRFTHLEREITAPDLSQMYLTPQAARDAITPHLNTANENYAKILGVIAKDFETTLLFEIGGFDFRYDIFEGGN